MSRLHDFIATRCPIARRCGRGFSLSCPCPDHGRGRGDRNRSLAISEGEEGQVLLYCHAGCRLEDILAALGASWSELFPCSGLGAHHHRSQRKRVCEPRGSLHIDLGLARDPGIAKLAEAAITRARGWPLEELSRDTGPSVGSYERLQTGYLVGELAERAGLNDGSIAYSFPMRLPHGPVCGVRVRSRSGRKWAVQGSRNGLFIPEGVDLQHDRLVLCEGPTDTAALLDLGVPAVGRPDAQGRLELCAELARQNRAGQIVVVADNDAPGLEGAFRCARALRVQCPDVRVVQPPIAHKDVRQWALADASRGAFESLVALARPIEIWCARSDEEVSHA
ncbi:MAG: toprim domain-containing protein [Polyangiaceae bacterium]|nr:toprim domain-containing protein [Polyangiaceae bacterium]